MNSGTLRSRGQSISLTMPGRGVESQLFLHIGDRLVVGSGCAGRLIDGGGRGGPAVIVGHTVRWRTCY
jgi:hypothetical protein